MKTPTRPKQNDTVNRAKLARMMGVSLPTIDDWQRRGCPVEQAGDRGRSYGFNVQAVIEWRVKDERRRQGLSLAALSSGDGQQSIGHNPLRRLVYDAVLSYTRFTFCKPILEDMVEAAQKKTGCDLRTAKHTVLAIYYIQRIMFAEWTVKDWFNQNCDEDLDDLLVQLNPRAKFIRGPLSDEKITSGEHTPDAVEELMVELFGKPSDEG